jgi:hypothetical protein
MRPRADFECKRCEKTIEDLPTESTRCPLCGRKKGFRRLYNKVQTSTRGHRVARFIDRKLQPAYDAKDARVSGAKKFAADLKAAEAKTIELGTPEVREAMAQTKQGLGVGRMAAATALSQVDPGARFDSQHFTFPAVKRHVVPQFVK